MLWGEFIDGTQCKQNEHNFRVYKQLESLYLEYDLTKQDVYRMAEKMLDNSPSPEMVEWYKGIQDEIKTLEYEIKSSQTWLDYYENMKGMTEDKETLAHYKKMVKHYKGAIQDKRWRLSLLKSYKLI